MGRLTEVFPVRLTSYVWIAVLTWGTCQIGTQNEHRDSLGEASLEEAENAYFRFELAKARSLFERVWNDPGIQEEDRAQAGRQLATIAWVIDSDVEAARNLLDALHEWGEERFKTLLVRARVERESGHYQAAREAAATAVDEGRSRLDIHDAYVSFARATLEQTLEEIIEKEGPGSGNRELLEEAYARIDSVLREEPGALISSETAFGLALLLGKGAEALEAWRSYYRVPSGEVPSGVLDEPGRVLESILLNWQGKPLKTSDRERLVLALAGSRFFHFAAAMTRILASTNDEDGPQIGEIMAYAAYLRRIEAKTITFYRTMARGGGDRDSYKKEMEKEAERLWAQLYWPEGSRDFTVRRFLNEISNRFGAVVSYRNANSHFGLHIGHRVVDEERQVEQYGRKAQLRHVVLDFMVSNGYSSWFWDGRAQVGGWADKTEFTQIRAAYANGGIDAWKAISDPQKRQETEQRIADMAARDDSVARLNPHTYLPGLAKRITYEGHQRLLKALQAQEMSKAELRLAFIAELERMNFASSILAHEGRHAIDAQDFRHNIRQSAEKEYRAKLSEVVFAPDPFLALGGGILIRNIGDDTAHGQANERIIKGLVEWMEEHAGEIEGLDVTRPYLPQLDLLTDEQLRQIFRSMDPMAS